MSANKTDSKALNIYINSKVYDMLDKVAKETELSKATIVNNYLAKGLAGWFENNEPNSPVFKKWKDFNKKTQL